jgi:D-ribose pyranase
VKKNMLIHSEISYLIARLGHMDRIVIADSGLPVPRNVQKIDLALTGGIPGFIDTLKVIMSEMKIEKTWIAEEWLEHGDQVVYNEMCGLLDNTPTETLPHDNFKEMVNQTAVAVIRTGECTPYANIILQSGVVF